ncbi:MAG: haloacid dehalogenase-like hydrolase [Aeromicrobium erythreum]
MSTGPAVGFDLDMTLIDSRPGIRATYAEVARRTGAPIDPDVAVSRLGPPLEVELASWVSPDQVADLVVLFRRLYPELAVPRIDLLPGAREAVAAVRALGGRSFVLTAKHAASARLHVDHLDLAVDDVVGDAWREGKADVLRERGAAAYVGDHVHDMEAGRGADVLTIGVTTGPCAADELRAAGADHVVPSLHAVGDLLAGLPQATRER